MRICDLIPYDACDITTLPYGVCYNHRDGVPLIQNIQPSRKLEPLDKAKTPYFGHYAFGDQLAQKLVFVYNATPYYFHTIYVGSCALPQGGYAYMPDHAQGLLASIGYCIHAHKTCNDNLLS